MNKKILIIFGISIGLVVIILLVFFLLGKNRNFSEQPKEIIKIEGEVLKTNEGSIEIMKKDGEKEVIPLILNDNQEIEIKNNAK